MRWSGRLTSFLRTRLRFSGAEAFSRTAARRVRSPPRFFWRLPFQVVRHRGNRASRTIPCRVPLQLREFLWRELPGP